MKLTTVVPAVLCVGLAGALVVVVTNQNNAPAEPTQAVAGQPTLSYATGVTVVDEDSMQNAVEEAINKMGQIAVSYQGQAFSENGKDFSCYIANSKANEYDMYIGIYESGKEADPTVPPLFLSGLIKPGEAFETITLTRTLDPGTYDCTLSMTLVDDDHQTLKGQTLLGYTLEVE